MQLGFKRLTPDNWLKPDRALATFASLSVEDGSIRPVEPDECTNGHPRSL